jgi:hypothetical protein
MKKLVIASAAIAVLSTTVASATYLVSKDRANKLEEVARLENLSVVALHNQDLMLACKAQIVAAETAKKSADKNSHDVVGAVTKSRDAICSQATADASPKKKKAKKA